METTTLAGAIEAIQKNASAATQPMVVTISADDGKGSGVAVPVLAYVGPEDGVISIFNLDSEIQHASRLANEQRLSKAAGPDRREGTAILQALASLISHANRFKSDNSAVWADAKNRTLVAVLDYHKAGAESAASWGRHRGVYPCPLSEAWEKWGGGKALKLDQDDFAALLDSRDRELVGGKLPSGAGAPDPSFLISLASKLEVFANATAKRERDQNTGRLRISYVEEKGVSGDIIPPPSFLVNIPVFEDSAPQPLEVRLRVTVDEKGQATFTVQIHAAGDVLRAAFGELCNEVARQTALPIFIGNPE